MHALVFEIFGLCLYQQRKWEEMGRVRGREEGRKRGCEGGKGRECEIRRNGGGREIGREVGRKEG